MPVSKVLAVTRLRKSYRDIVAVDDVSFEVRQNEIVGLLGRNGAGKTTIISIILGILAPTAGKVCIDGFDIATRRTAALTLTNFAAVYAPLPGNLTVNQNLTVFGLLYGVRDLKKRISTVLRQFELETFKDTKCGVLSSGEQTRVSLAKAMLNSPTLLLLDEPTASLDPAVAGDLRNKIKRIVKDGRSGVLWTSHNMYEVEEVCDRVLFLSSGKILLEGDPRVLPHQHGKSSLEELFISVTRETDAVEVP